MKDIVEEIERNYDETGDGLQKTVPSLSDDIATLVAQRRDEEESLSEESAELKDDR